MHKNANYILNSISHIHKIVFICLSLDWFYSMALEHRSVSLLWMAWVLNVARQRAKTTRKKNIVLYAAYNISATASFGANDNDNNTGPPFRMSCSVDYAYNVKYIHLRRANYHDNERQWRSPRWPDSAQTLTERESTKCRRKKLFLHFEHNVCGHFIIFVVVVAAVRPFVR